MNLKPFEIKLQLAQAAVKNALRRLRNAEQALKAAKKAALKSPKK